MKKLINQGLIAFYCRYVDVTVLLVIMIKRNTITKILEQFCKFDRNIFTFDLVGNTTQYFLDINMASDGLAIYTKDTFTRQYTNFESFVLWQYKVSWVRERIDRVHQMCTPNKIKTEIILKEIF